MSAMPRRRVPGEAPVVIPSIRSRLANALAAWAVVWGLAVGAAVWYAAAEEVDELLDDVLKSSATLLATLAADPAVMSAIAGANGGAAAGEPAPAIGDAGLDSFAWQVVAADGRVSLRSLRAPATAWRATSTPGFSDVAEWRLYGVALAADDRMLYTAQTMQERQEARAETALGAVLAALAVGLVGHVWLRSRVRAELEPLQKLSQRLATFDVDADDAASTTLLGPAERRELQPVHQALEALMQRLSARVDTERAFSAHAAHALRTPLAGIDAQLAVALRECPPALSARLQRVRDAATRLQGVVAALLGLFRTGGQVRRSAVDVAGLLSRLPVAGLQVQVEPGTQVHADADLLAAALVNLLDNALRHGARQVTVSLCAPGRLRLADDGPGMAAERRVALQTAVDAQAYEGRTGLGLMLADRVARAHGGHLHLPEIGHGFAVELELGPATPAAAPARRPS